MNKAIILGAGQGSRLGKYTNNLPKPFVDVGQNKILEWQLNGLAPICDEVLLVLGYGFEDIENPNTFVNSQVSIPKSVDLATLVLDDWHEYENGGSCYRALQSDFVSNDDNVLLVCGDVIFSHQIVSNFNKNIEDEKEVNSSYVFTIEGIQDEMTAVRWSEGGYITDYGAIKGHQEAGIFFLNSNHILTASEILSQNQTDWFPIIFPKVKSKPFLIDSEKHAEINTPDHLDEAEDTVVDELTTESSLIQQ